MLAPLLAIALLLLLLYILLRPTPRPPPHTKPTPTERLLTDAFQFCPATATSSLLILYATEYGFSREVARRAAAALSTHRVRILSIADFSAADFQREHALLLVASTTGDGVPPHDAAEMRSALTDGRVALSGAYAVLALGDRAYSHFCRGGHVLASEMTAAFRKPPLLPTGEVDQEDWHAVDAWVARFRTALPPAGAAALGDDYLIAALKKYGAKLERGGRKFSRADPFPAALASKHALTTAIPGEKHVIRAEFAVGAALAWAPGDALGVLPQNNPTDVEALLCAVAATGDEIVVITESDGGAMGTPLTFAAALGGRLDLKIVRAEMIDTLALATEDADERALAARLLARGARHGVPAVLSEEGRKYTEMRHVLDVLGDFVGATLSPAEIARLLRPLAPRYYSISSTPSVSPDRIAITADVLRYRTNNSEREGVASTFLCDRVAVDSDDRVPIFVMRNDNFRLPADASRPIIMIGPGTGVAPFIAFIDERVASGAQGRNLLFFGCRHEANDFLYRTRLTQAVAAGELEMFTAFSRDQAEKVYVQHRLWERRDDIWALLDEEKAHVYVCGDGRRMAPDVDNVLRHICVEKGGMSEAEARDYLVELDSRKRMQRDVWIP